MLERAYESFKNPQCFFCDGDVLTYIAKFRRGTALTFIYDMY